VRSILQRRARLALAAAAVLPLLAADTDRDGLDDALEQTLLERFTPVLLLSATDCAGMPAQFHPDRPHPEEAARNGTLYGQVTPRGEGRVEIHYYHLWASDCGRGGHSLDAEHVSVLIAEEGGLWRALYWYAAAHEDTPCNASSGAPARALAAETRGARVWVSRGKHASFLDRGACPWGCGGDVCQEGIAWRAGRVINLGEPDAIAEGMQWVRSPRWPLLAKMGSDFPDARREQLARAAGVQSLTMSLRPAQSLLLAGDTTADALGIARSSTGNALATAGRKTSGALEESTARTARAVGLSLRKTGRFLGLPQRKREQDSRR